MPDLAAAPADSAVTGAEKLLTIDFESVTVQQVANANESKSADIASAATTDLSNATTPFLHITGTTTITGFGSVQAGTERVLVFDGILTLTHNATSLILPTAANIVTAVGDVAIFRSEGSGNWRCMAYQRANGSPVANTSDRSTVSVVTPSAGTATFNYALGDYFTLAPTANVTTIAFSNLPGSGHGASLLIYFTQDSTPRTVAWPASFKWAGGVAGAVSTGSGAKDIIAITTFDNGTTWNATIAKAFA